MTKILGFSALAQGGKNTSANYIIGLYLLHLGIVRGRFSLNDKGQIYISDAFGDTAHEGIFDILRDDNENFINFRKEYLDPYIKLYSFADWLKSIAINVFGLTKEQCYGTDEDKNTVVPHLLWENLPGVITEKIKGVKYKEVQGRLGLYYEHVVSGLESNGTFSKVKNNVDISKLGLIYHKPGPMTAREFLQYFGTDIGRRIWGNCWVNACISQIKNDKPELAICADVRFPNEVFGIKNAGGKVLRLTRDVRPKDAHESERALDADRYDWSNFDYICKNDNMSIEEQCDALYDILEPAGFIPLSIKEEVSANSNN